MITKLKRFFRRQPNVNLAYVFGSTAKQRKKIPNDLDIAVSFRRLPTDPLRRLKAQVTLTAQLETLTNRPVDLAVLNTASSTLHQQVFKYGILLHEARQRLHRDYQVRKLNEHFDLQPLRDFFLRRLDQRLGLR